MQVETTSYVYRERYPFGKLIHSVMLKVEASLSAAARVASIISESCVLSNELAIEEEIEIAVTCNYIPGDPGNPSQDPDRYDPPTPEEIENVQAWRNGEPFKLTQKEEKLIVEELLEVSREKYEASLDSHHYYDDDYDRDDYDRYDRDCDYWDRIE